MPRKFRRSKRRQTVSDGWLAWALGIPLDQDDPRFQQWVDFEYFASDEEIAAMWRPDGNRVVEAWVVDNPGSRPPLWWRHDASEPRRHISGSGRPMNADCYRNGMPRFMIEIETEDPPIFESQATYLDRLGLLLPGERKRLTAEDFEPDVLGSYSH